jgi:hypothetical protein
MSTLTSPVITEPRGVRRGIRTLRRSGRGLALFVALLMLLVAAAWSYDAYASPRVIAAYPPPGQFVQVGGAKMHYVCQGAGEPSLVLEAGIPGGLLDWTPAHDAEVTDVSRLTRV